MAGFPWIFANVRNESEEQEPALGPAARSLPPLMV